MPRPYPPITGQEGLNPTKFYAELRPRQAVRGSCDLTSGVGQYNDQGVFNNSTGTYYLLVRAWFTMLSAPASGAGGWFMLNSNLGMSGASFVENYWKSGGQLPGIMVAANDATQRYPNIWRTSIAAGQFNQWTQTYPFALVEPGWALMYQAAVQNVTLATAMIWECLTADELDYFMR